MSNYSKHQSDMLGQDSLDALFIQAVDFFEKNKTSLIAVGLAIVIASSGLIFSNHQTAKQNQEAANLLAKIQPAYEAENYQMAIYGEGDTDGLLKIANDYGNTNLGNIAKLYLGKAFFEKGSYDSALTYFESASLSDDLVAASVLAGQAATLEAQLLHEKAAVLFEKAAKRSPLGTLTPFYLGSAARNFELAGKKEEALQIYIELDASYKSSKAGKKATEGIARLKG